MNLADIRKKANRDREDAAVRPEKAQPDAPEILAWEDEIEAEQGFVPIEPDIEGEPFNLSELEIEDNADDDPYDVMLEHPVEEEPKPVELAVPPRIISTPALPASVATEFPVSLPESSAASASEIKESPLVSIPEPESNQDQLFDPLAILMAGRASSGYGDEPDFTSDEVSETEIADYQEFLCFRVCSEQYAINIMEIKEIIKPREITEVPRSPDFISGVLSLRGIIIPIFNMVKRLHLEPVDIGSRERIIVVSKGEELFGILVDEVLQVVRIPEGAIEQPPAVLEGIDRDFVLGIGRHSSGMLILLNMVSILDVSLY
jgi:purine-binding chemotaxis protein CheW